MIPEISEFSYGFALTNELVGWAALKAAPVFPSLIEEGKKGGGYDVKLDAPGKPLFLQFKRAHCMTRRSAREISKYGLRLTPSFYRFAITERKISFQHTSLYELDDGSNLVFYVAPRFHTLDEINFAWERERVAERSIFVSPREIGLIDDDDAHTISYDEWGAYFCSEPKEITAFNIGDLQQQMKTALEADTRPVRAQLAEWMSDLKATRERAQRTQSELEWEIRQRKSFAREAIWEGAEEIAHRFTLPEYAVRRAPPPGPEMQIRAPKPLDADQFMLRQISDQAIRFFNVQLLIVQPA